MIVPAAVSRVRLADAVFGRSLAVSEPSIGALPSLSPLTSSGPDEWFWYNGAPVVSGALVPKSI